MENYSIREKCIRLFLDYTEKKIGRDEFWNRLNVIKEFVVEDTVILH